MDLTLLVPLVVGGIALIVVLVRTLVNHEERLITDNGMATEAFGRDYPLAETTGDWLISSDNRVALCELNEPEGALGLVEVMGSKHVTRILGAADIREIGIDGMHLRLHLNDVTLAKVDLMMAEPEQGEQAARMLERVQNQAAEITHKATMA